MYQIQGPHWTTASNLARRATFAGSSEFLETRASQTATMIANCAMFARSRSASAMPKVVSNAMLLQSREFRIMPFQRSPALHGAAATSARPMALQASGPLACPSEMWNSKRRSDELRKWFASTPSSSPASSQRCKLRVIFVNDVYELDNWPRFLTAVNTLWEEGATIVCLPGDFVAPSILSTLDHGKGMVDCMNRCKIDYVCFGNHETDIPWQELISRIKESTFTWINSNMRDLDTGDITLPEYKIVEVTNGGQTRRVGLLGLLSEDPGLYRPHSFNDATISPIIEEADRLRDHLYREQNVDLVLPMTHQSVAQDRRFAEFFQHKGVENENAFPLVLGAHDHDPYQEEVGGSVIIKTGMDINNVGICDITWDDSQTKAVKVDVRLEDIMNFEPDVEIQGVVEEHKKVLTELDSAPLFKCDGEAWLGSLPMTTKDNRLRETNLSTKLVSSIRDALGCECCFVNAGNIRGDMDYPAGKKFFTYNDLKTEILFDCEVVTMPLPGRVIAEAISYSRAPALLPQPEAHGMFVQVCDNMTVDTTNHTLTHIGGQPLDPDRTYSCGLPFMMLTGLDDVPSLVHWAENNPDLFPREACGELGRPAKLLLVDYFSKAFYYELGTLENIDKDGKGYISRQDIYEGVKAHFGEPTATICVENIMRAADANGDGMISKEELLRVHFMNAWARREMDENQDGLLTKQEVEAFAQKILGNSYEKDIVDNIFDELDRDHHHQLSHADVERWISMKFNLHSVSVPGQTLDRREIQAVKDKVFCSGDPRMLRERQKRTGGHWELLSRSPARTDGGKGVEGGPRD